MKIGDKLICKKTIDNIYGMPLFVNGKIYTVLGILRSGKDSRIVLDHILYANEYTDFDFDFVNDNFSKYEG